MARYPFMEEAAKIMRAREGCMAEVSWKNLYRRYRRIERDLIRLSEEGRISSVAPKKMTEQDVKAFILYRKDKGVCASDISHDISALDQLLQYSGNLAVKTCLTNTPGLKPRSNDFRLEPLPEKTYRRVLARSNEIDQYDYYQVRAYALVLMYIGTGARNKELRLADITDLDTENWRITLRHVKGEGSYGHIRTVHIPAEIRPIIEQYLVVRDARLRSLKGESKALFFGNAPTFEHLSGNAVRKVKKVVEEDLEVTFELRDCRRACGQFYLNKGLSIEDVSGLLGHYSSVTTERYYCKQEEEYILQRAAKKW